MRLPLHDNYQSTGWLLWPCCVLTETTTTRELYVQYGVNLTVAIGGELYKVVLLGMSGGKKIFACPGILSHLFVANFLHS